MTTPGLLELNPLPSGAAALLESFRRAHDAAFVRLWARTADGWTPLYPEGVEAPTEPDPDSRRERVRIKRLPPLELEIGGAGVAPAESAFLARGVALVIGYEREARTAARELAERYEEINLLYTISEVLGSVLSLDAAASRILTEVADVLGARRASLWVHDLDDELLHLAAAVGERGRTDPIAVDDEQSVTAWVFRERQPLNLERESPLPPGIRMDLRPRRHEAFLSVPINFTPPEGTSRTVGVITLVGRRTDVRFSAGDARLLTAIASQVGAAIEIHRLVGEILEQERLVHELELAHDLQLKLLPEATQFDGAADAAARCAPAESVGGDFYHFFRLPDDRLGVMIGDVSSHGFSAALIMAMTMSAAAIHASEAGPPGQVLHRVHRTLIDELESTEMYMTIFYGVIDRAQGELVYANAGHPHAFRIAADGAVERLRATNPPLGTVPLDVYGQGRARWVSPRDLLCLFTDGLSDTLGATASRPGEDVLLDALLDARDRPAREILDRLFALSERSSPEVPPDDRTAVLLRA